MNSRTILIFSGTTEGRNLAEHMASAGVFCHVCVATEYGASVMKPNVNIAVHEGRLDTEEMKQLIGKTNPQIVIDATHPFAEAVSENIMSSCRETKKEYIRLQREVAGYAKTPRMIPVSSMEEAVRKAASFDTILLTTGSKSLYLFRELISAKKDIYARVIPSEESLRLCKDAGIEGSHVIAVQGPFSEEYHMAMLKNYGITCQVTKASGAAGGFWNKINAAEKLGIVSIVIAPPAESGYSYDETVKMLEEKFGIAGPSDEKRTAEHVCRPSAERTLYAIGMGMGCRSGLTIEAESVLKDCEVIFTASALKGAAEGMGFPGKIICEYRWEPIRTYLRAHPKITKAAVLYSGDPGFYSGAALLPKNTEEFEIVRIPGISSMSYLAAKAGILWNDAKIVSIHGRNANWLRAAETNEKVFMLTSGNEDIKNICTQLSGNEKTCEAKLVIGFNLAGPDERIFTLSVSDAVKIPRKQGLYSLFILNDNAKASAVHPVFSDSDFIRGKVPMTKEEVRHLSVLSLQLSKKSILWDIGAGTGSVSLEAAAADDSIRVFSFENNNEACDLITKNAEKLHLGNVTVMKGSFPDEISLKGVPAPTHVFIGGTGKQCREIFRCLESVWKEQKENMQVRISANAVTLESVHELTEAMKQYCCDVKITQIAVSRSHKVGSYHMMKAENPIYMFSGVMKKQSGDL